MSIFILEDDVIQAQQMKRLVEEICEKYMLPFDVIIEKADTFEKIEKQSIEEKDGLYTVILVAKYSKEQRTYIITYNDKEEIAGLFIK